MAQVVGGALKDTKWFQVVGGLLVPAKQGLQVVGGVYKEFYSAGVAVTLANATNVNIQSLFDPADWVDAGKTKRVIIPAGVTIGSNSTTISAIRTGTGWGGDLIIENAGALKAAGGVSGVGGDAFLAEADGVILNNTGDIWAGGGRGALGGTGGQGSFSSTVDSGWKWQTNYWWTHDASTWFTGIFWGGQIYSGYLGVAGVPGKSPHTVSGYTYTRGSQTGWSGNPNYYQIKRTYSSTSYTTGGGPGTRGRGQGFDGNLTAGTNGANGGTNAGKGGASGDGGDWGQPGDPGASGANGNHTNGTAAGAASLAGYAIKNSGFVTLTDTGSLLGR